MNKTILTSLLFTTLFISSYSGKTNNSNKGIEKKIEKKENLENDIIRISYNQIINGYQVNVIWKPNALRYDMVVGPAILEFKNNKSQFTLTNNYFALPTRLIDLKTKDNSITGINTNEVSIDYKEPNIQYSTFLDQSLPNVPFVFLDLNFDGKKELLVTKFEQGQRTTNEYDAYGYNYFGDIFQITEEPYNQIDGFTILDKDNKELILYGSNGICHETYHTYSLINNRFDLTKIVRMERDDDTEKCYKLTYSVLNRTEKLISKE
tara:strand:+ start:82 stop:873 length:792 start_codon:yes stop_codon:yes gene_type:complete